MEIQTESTTTTKNAQKQQQTNIFTGRSWTTNHFVPLLRQQSTDAVIPPTNRPPTSKNTTMAKPPVPPTANVSMYFDEDNSFTEQSESRYSDTTKRELIDPPATNVSMNIVADESVKHVEESESSVEDFTTTELPVPPTAKPLRQGRWLSKEELYQLVIEPNEVVEVVPPGDKSNCYLSVDNERNMKRLSASTTKKCDFFDDCGTWDREKGNTVKTTYVVTDDSLRHVELKNNLYSTKMRQQKKVVWVPLDPKPESQNVVTISRYYATSKTDPSFEKRVSYFVWKTDTSLGNVAVYEYRGIQPKRDDPHGNAKTNEGFVRTNPKTFDQIQAKIKTNKQPREIFAGLKKNDSLTCVIPGGKSRRPVFSQRGSLNGLGCFRVLSSMSQCSKHCTFGSRCVLCGSRKFKMSLK